MNILMRITLSILLIIQVSCEYVYSQDNDEYYFLMLFSNVLNHVKSNYFEEVPVDILYKGAIKGVLQELDPHTRYLSPENLDRLTQINHGMSFGVGIEFDIIDSQPVVISVIKGSPADKKNIRTGDVLVEIDGEKVPDDIASVNLILRLHGERNTNINLKFKRGNSFISTKLKRDKIELSSVPLLTIINPDIGYIKCTNFSLTTSDKFEKAVRTLLKKDVTHLIIDIRDNPGGLVESAIRMIDLFLLDGRKILSTTGRKDVLINEIFAEDEEFINLPLTILINNGTASASEILAGSLQDNKRAKIIGTDSFGKGLIQRIFLLDNGGALLMTVGEYRTPSGRKVQRQYKGKSFQEYYDQIKQRAHSIPVDSVSSSVDTEEAIIDRGGIHPDIFVEQNEILDSLDYSVRYQKYITKRAINLINQEDFKSKYKDYIFFKDSFNINTIAIDDSLSHDDRFVELLQTYIKAEIARMLWGEYAEFDIRRCIDNQLDLAIKDILGE